MYYLKKRKRHLKKSKKNTLFSSSSGYIDSRKVGDNFNAPPSLTKQKYDPYLNSVNLDNPYISHVNYDNYKNSFIYPTKPTSKTKETKLKIGIKKIISFFKNTFPSLTVLFTTE